ncbi:MAG TPA: thiamine phosphate synthase [Isosphaeraceae bacterium]|jgi:thiamine-phosphate pyrophosphorylase|nr:thiamine phosphate synthase [Isosphaeraceae bacterium]
MRESFTAGATRALARAGWRAKGRGAARIEPTDLLAALADEAESRAATILAGHGVEPAGLIEALGLAAIDPDEPEPAEDTDPLPQSPDLRVVVGEAALAARAYDRGRAVGTEHLLVALLGPGPLADLVAGLGLDPAAVRDEVMTVDTPETGPIAIGADEPAPLLADPHEAGDLARILDAAANRAREGLRVAEDYARFVLDDPTLTKRLKDVRHRLAAALGGLDPDLLLAGRDTLGDVGTHIMTPSEQHRAGIRAVLLANFKRTAEALRTLEEYSKLLDPWLAGRFEVLRYDVYTIEKMTMTAVAARRGIGDARLYVLVGGLPTLGDLTWVVGEALEGGAQAIQLREKGLPDRALLERARAVRKLTAESGAVFLLNDRPDLARIVGADGVHLGQDDLPVREARRVVGPNALIGASTHAPDQLEAALLAGAHYLGVGPVFSSLTKEFDAFAGLDYVRHAAASTALPWFALGGITLENLDEALAAGARRVAVSAAVVHADRPRHAAASFRARLEGDGSDA